MNVKIFNGNDGIFVFWTPEPDAVVLVGPEQRQVPLPQMPLPVYAHLLQDAERPADDALGAGIYDYLRRYPDCEGGHPLADLLRNAFPHYLADIASQVIMIEEKEVDAAFIRRQISGLKILSLLEAQPQLLFMLGRSYYELATMFTELAECRSHLLAAREYLGRSLTLAPEQPAALNLLAQIESWFGETFAALSLWKRAADLVTEPTRQALLNRAAAVAGNSDKSPLVDELEALGSTLVMIGSGDFAAALLTLERLEEEGRVTTEMPSPEFYYLLGYCREQTGDPGNALVAYAAALSCDPEYAPAQTGFERIQQG